jgi:hypothetical protein
MADHVNTECHYAECRNLFIIILNVVMLSVIEPDIMTELSVKAIYHQKSVITPEIAQI